jgi:hypothetical protein
LKKKKAARTNTATAAEPKADNMPINMPFPVDVDGLSLTLILPPSARSHDIDEKGGSGLDATCCGSTGDGVSTAVGKIGGTVLMDVARVEGASQIAPGADASDPRIVH